MLKTRGGGNLRQPSASTGSSVFHAEATGRGLGDHGNSGLHGRAFPGRSTQHASGVQDMVLGDPKCPPYLRKHSVMHRLSNDELASSFHATRIALSGHAGAHRAQPAHRPVLSTGICDGPACC